MNTLQDIRYALRMLLKRPSFTVIVVLTLALGIGANTTIFSAIDAVLLNPLPYKDPERLMVVWETNKQLGPEMWDRNEAAIGNFLDWRSRNQVFDQLGALFDTDMNLTGVGEPQRIKSYVVTTNFFQVLGVQPMLGRSFLSEAEMPGSPFTVVISYELWQRQFGSDPNIIDKNLTLNGHQVAVIGVMPPAFELQFPRNVHADMWVPMVIDTADPDYHDRSNNFLYTLGRLKPGVSQEQAQAEMNLIASQLQLIDKIGRRIHATRGRLCLRAGRFRTLGDRAILHAGHQTRCECDQKSCQNDQFRCHEAITVSAVPRSHHLPSTAQPGQDPR